MNNANIATTQILHINSSVFGDNGQSSQLARRFVDEWRKNDPAIQVTFRDVVSEEVPHLNNDRVQAFFTPAEKLTPSQRQFVDYSNTLIREVQKADVIVIGLPLYNLGVPSQLKAYFDHIARAGITFRYTANGPEGLLKGKKVYVFAARGGLYQGTPLDTQTDYISHFFNFIGVENIEFIYAEGLNMNEDKKISAIANAHTEIDRLLQTSVAA